MNKKMNEQKGVAAIEFAIVLPVLALLLFGTIEFGLLLYNQQVITNASREGARAGIVLRTPRLSDDEIGNIISSYCGNRLITFGSPQAPQIDINRVGSNFGDDLTVTVTYHYDFLVLANLGFDPVDLTAQTVMKME
jgi:Flp pilus assembly protein TadG